VNFEDRGIRAGLRYGYRLAAGGAVGGEVWVDIPAAPVLSLRALRNPTSGPIKVVFSLESSQPARLELFDISGRRIASLDVGSLGTGTHESDLGGAGLPPGLFVARITQREESRAIRVIHMR